MSALSKKTKVTLISPGMAVNAIGLRTISSYLKEQGCETQMIFLSSLHQPFSVLYSEKIIDDVVNLCRDSDLIAISVMTNNFIAVRDLTEKLKKRVSIPIIWGGIHPTVCPDECIAIADIICIGEGEDAMIELADNLHDPVKTDIKNIWFRRGSEVIKNMPRHLEHNLDKYPFPDYALDGHFIIDGERIVPMTEGLLQRALSLTDDFRQSEAEYLVLTSRGCPHRCSYCCNNAMERVYAGSGSYALRQRSIDSVILELANIKRRYPFIKRIMIADETFLCRSLGSIQKFAKRYRNEIALPLGCMSSPAEIDDVKLGLLADSGLRYLAIGIQSADRNVLSEIYCRKALPESVERAISIVNKFSNRIPNPLYQFISDNPWESRRAMRTTAKFIARLPENALIVVFPLVLFPGTELYLRAEREGLIGDKIKDIYLKGMNPSDVRRSDYYTRLLYFQQDLRLRHIVHPTPFTRLTTIFRKTWLIHVSFLTFLLLTGELSQILQRKIYDKLIK